MVSRQESSASAHTSAEQTRPRMGSGAIGKVAFATNLPTQVTSFIGRDREIAEVMRLLAETRLLTLTGTGGVREDSPRPAGGGSSPRRLS